MERQGNTVTEKKAQESTSGDLSLVLVHLALCAVVALPGRVSLASVLDRGAYEASEDLKALYSLPRAKRKASPELTQKYLKILSKKANRTPGAEFCAALILAYADDKESLRVLKKLGEATEDGTARYALLIRRTRYLSDEELFGILCFHLGRAPGGAAMDRMFLANRLWVDYGPRSLWTILEAGKDEERALFTDDLLYYLSQTKDPAFAREVLRYEWSDSMTTRHTIYYIMGSITPGRKRDNRSNSSYMLLKKLRKLAGQGKLAAGRSKNPKDNRSSMHESRKAPDPAKNAEGSTKTVVTAAADRSNIPSRTGEVHSRAVRSIPLDDDVSLAKAPKLGVQIKTATEVTLGAGDSAKKVNVHYLLSLPGNYDKQDKCPLIIFLHGMGERGNDLNRVKAHGPPKLVSKSNTTGFIIVSPQCPKSEYWRIQKLSKLLDHILATTKADPQRVYLTGLSMGGFGTWAWAAREPQRFAAAIPICGGGDPSVARQLVKLPIWAFHGRKDNIVPLSSSKAMVGAIRKAGGTKVTLTVYPQAGHNSWTKTYSNPDIYKWLLKHRRRTRE